MIVTCKLSQCPYNDQHGYCAKRTVLAMDELGMCKVIWTNGQQKTLVTPFTDELYPKHFIQIVDTLFENVDENAPPAEN